MGPVPDRQRTTSTTSRRFAASPRSCARLRGAARLRGPLAGRRLAPRPPTAPDGPRPHTHRRLRAAKSDPRRGSSNSRLCAMSYVGWRQHAEAWTRRPSVQRALGPGGSLCAADLQRWQRSKFVTKGLRAGRGTPSYPQATRATRDPIRRGQIIINLKSEGIDTKTSLTKNKRERSKPKCSWLST